jgi:hypothetical protein
MAAARVRVLFIVGSALSTLAAMVALSCSSEPEVHYGSPGSLNKDRLPGEAGAAPLACGEGGISDEGGTGTAGACAVSWKNDIYANMISGMGWQCASAACHGPGKNAPEIDPTDASKTLATLKAYKLSSHMELAYIDESGDPSKSSIECNLSAGCNPAMPLNPGRALTDDERCKLHTWLLCKAPDN